METSDVLALGAIVISVATGLATIRLTIKLSKTLAATTEALARRERRWLRVVDSYEALMLLVPGLTPKVGGTKVMGVREHRELQDACRKVSLFGSPAVREYLDEWLESVSAQDELLMQPDHPEHWMISAHQRAAHHAHVATLAALREVASESRSDAELDALPSRYGPPGFC